MTTIRRKRALIFGGAGSLGRVLTKKFIDLGDSVVVFSRDEAKHHYMRQELGSDLEFADFILGDVRDKRKVKEAISNIRPHTIINAAAMKQVPACEFFPEEALLTNTIGTRNIVESVQELSLIRDMANVKVLSVSTDKSCKPVNAYGMTKALQERIHLNGNGAVFNCVRYGNVLESTGSVIPFFKAKIKAGENLPITHPEMTRFLMSLQESVELILTALLDVEGGKIFVPHLKSAYIQDLAEIMLEGTGLSYYNSGIRPGEKMHEILVSEEELLRTELCGNTYVIHDIKKPFCAGLVSPKAEYSSKDSTLNKEDLKAFLKERGAL